MDGYDRSDTGVPDHAGDAADLLDSQRIGSRIHFLSAAEGFDGKAARGQPPGLCTGSVICVEVRLSGRRIKTDTVPRASGSRLTYETAAQPLGRGTAPLEVTVEIRP